MTANLTVYGRASENLEQLVTGLVKGGRVERADDGRVVVKWPDASVRIGTMPRDRMQEHLAGFVGFVTRACDVRDPSLPARIPTFAAVYGCVIEPGLDAGGKVHALVFGLARALEGVVFVGGPVVDPEGVALATPRARRAAGAGGSGGTGSGSGTGGAGAVEREDKRDHDDDDGDDDDDDDEEPEPPDAARVLRRAYCLGAVAMRGVVEDEPRDEARALVERARAWLAKHAFDRELEDAERALLAAPVGEAERRAVVNAGWRSESLCVLAWALGGIEMPAHDEQVDPAEVSSAIGFLDEPQAAPRLRPRAEIEWMARRLLGIHWRLRDFSLRPKAMDFAAFARKNWFGGFDLEGIALAGGDLAVGGKPIAEADARRVGACHCIAVERHQAINWLEGQAALYSDVDTST